jgi:hypothetical protein
MGENGGSPANRKEEHLPLQVPRACQTMSAAVGVRSAQAGALLEHITRVALFVLSGSFPLPLPPFPKKKT